MFRLAARALCLALLAISTGAHDINQLLADLKFEPHHRNFVRNLYEKQMLVRVHFFHLYASPLARASVRSVCSPPLRRAACC